MVWRERCWLEDGRKGDGGPLSRDRLLVSELERGVCWMTDRFGWTDGGPMAISCLTPCFTFISGQIGRRPEAAL